MLIPFQWSSRVKPPVVYAVWPLLVAAAASWEQDAVLDDRGAVLAGVGRHWFGGGVAGLGVYNQESVAFEGQQRGTVEGRAAA
ncbi:hypothetical protein [Amycolatopsis sp. NPDC004079]|uniref:hypothetical protein n=1 Tax=Amycolatopsis sp. NPDC004079 TaxID=3154549 RepID=UPI0033AB6184